MFGLLNQVGIGIQEAKVAPAELAELVRLVGLGEINQNTGKAILAEMFASGETAPEIIAARGLLQISDEGLLAELVEKVLAENPEQVSTYLAGKTTVSQWLFGQVMRATKGRANPQVVREVLQAQLDRLQEGS